MYELDPVRYKDWFKDPKGIEKDKDTIFDFQMDDFKKLLKTKGVPTNPRKDHALTKKEVNRLIDLFREQALSNNAPQL